MVLLSSSFDGDHIEIVFDVPYTGVYPTAIKMLQRGGYRVAAFENREDSPKVFIYGAKGMTDNESNSLSTQSV